MIVEKKVIVIALRHTEHQLALWLGVGQQARIEIETAMGKIEEIDMCACVYNELKQQIVMFYSGKELAKEYILNFLITKLPDYMCPNKFIFMDKLPLNGNGKIDRKILKQEYINR